MIYATILACEIAFWVILGLGLLARYALRRRRIGAVLLATVPLVDVLLLVVTILDLRGGATPNTAHGLAGVYIGVSVAWGRSMVRWADERFAYRFAGGPPPSRPPRAGRAHARRERVQWLRHLLAFAVGSALLLGGSLIVGDPDRSAGLLGILPKWAMILGIDFLWSFSYTVFPRRGPSGTG